MLKKLPISLLLLMVFNLPLAAQHSHVEFTYQSLRPFIHFQLDFQSHDYHYDAYEQTYLKGYMDGVNDEHHYGYNFADMLLNFDAYRAGYRDGFRDRQLLIRLRGHRWYKRHRFAYDDYHAPVFAVRIWLDGLSLAFLQAPTHRLPKRWQYKAHPRVKQYRKWIANRSVNVERRFKKRIRGYQQRLDREKNRRRAQISHDRDHDERTRYRQNRGFSPFGDTKIDRDRDEKRRNRTINNNSRKSQRVEKDSRKKRTRGTVRERTGDDNKSNRRSRSSKSRSRDRDG